MLFNIYTNDQPVHADTRSFIYADDLCIASQGNDFNNIEASLTSALSTITTYYDTNQLRANPSKTQVCAFHLRNREAKRELNVMWNGTRLSNTTTPVYLGVHLDRTLCYKTHIEKTNMKVNARNNIIRKLVNSKWGCKASTPRTSCLALLYSAAEYACPVWARSTHAPKLNPALHDCCQIISGCLKPTHLVSVHLLAGILFVSLTALSASWPRREAGRSPVRHQRARCTANPRDVGKDLSHSGQLCGRARASTSTSVDTGSRSRICTCMPFDLGADISIEADAREPLASSETRAEASAAVQSSRPTSSAYSSLLAVTSHR